MSWQKFEEQFKQSGETDRGFDFNETAWNRMQTQLDSKKKKRRGFFWLWYLSAAVVVGGLLFYYNYSFDKEELLSKTDLITKQLLPSQNIETKKDQSFSTEAKKENLQNDNNIKTQPIRDTKNNNSEIPSTKVQVQAKQLTPITTTTSKSFDKRSTTNTTKKISPIDISTNKHNNYITKTKNTVNTFQTPTNKKLPTKNTHSQQKKYIAPSIGHSPMNVTLAKSNATSLIKSARAMDSELGLVSARNFRADTKKKKSGWEIGISYTPNFQKTYQENSKETISIYTTDSIPNARFIVHTDLSGNQHKLFLSETKKGKKNIIPFYNNFGIHLSKKLSKKFTLESGISFFFYNSKFPNFDISNTLDNSYIYKTKFKYRSLFGTVSLNRDFRSLGKITPYLGIRTLFGISSQNNISTQITADHIGLNEITGRSNTWGFDWEGFGSEFGIKYQVLPRINIRINFSLLKRSNRLLRLNYAFRTSYQF